MAIKIIQMSDTHLFAEPSNELLGVNTYTSFRAVCDKVKKEEMDAQLILLSGDLSQDHSEASYRVLSDLLKPFNKPVYYVPGNHDDPVLMKKAFLGGVISNDKHIILNDWQIILLNSQKPGAVEGLLDQSQLSYLQECLQAYPEHHAIIVLHHHPFPSGCKWQDNLGLSNAKVFWRIIANFPNVNTVLFGHVHQEIAKQVENINCYSVPSTCFQFKRKQAHFSLENLPQGYRWLALKENGQIETGVKRVATYVGKFDKDAKGY